MTYRANGEVAKLKAEHDPIQLFRNRVVELSLLTPSELDAIDGEIKLRIVQAVAEAKAAPMPTDSDLLTDVYNRY